VAASCGGGGLDGLGFFCDLSRERDGLLYTVQTGCWSLEKSVNRS
jgi:hypothetical protein